MNPLTPATLVPDPRGRDGIRRQVMFWLGGFAVIVLVLWLLSDILLPFIMGLAIAYLLTPLTDRMERHGVNRLAAALLIITVVVMLFVLLVLLVAPVLGGQLASFIDNIPLYVSKLRALMTATHREDRRGFSMILGRLFDGTEPDAVVMVARDKTGRIVGAHRYLWAGKQDLSLDLPIRAKGAPNGVDERLIAEVVAWGSEHGVERVSLAFAPFPDLFVNRHHLTPLQRLAYRAVHLLDPLIRVERLYLYLRKFHALGKQRYAVLRLRDALPVVVAMLTLEFGLRRTRRRERRGWRRLAHRDAHASNVTLPL